MHISFDFCFFMFLYFSVFYLWRELRLVKIKISARPLGFDLALINLTRRKVCLRMRTQLFAIFMLFPVLFLFIHMYQYHKCVHFKFDGFLSFFPDIPETKVKLGSSLDPNAIREGTDVYFDCLVAAHPHVYKVEWRHNVNILCICWNL